MPDKKLTDKEIVKALEDTLYRIKGAEHLIVPKEGVENLCNGLENALDLIKCLQAENESLKIDVALFKSTKKVLAPYITDNGIEYKEFTPLYRTAKTEAYKEFAERLEETKFKHGNDYIIYADNIDNLLKELVGEDK